MRNIFIGIFLILFFGCSEENYDFDIVYELISKDNFSESLNLLDSIKSINSNNKSIEFEANCIAGTIYYHLNEFDKAKKLLKDALQFEESQNLIHNSFFHQNDFESTKYVSGKILAEIYIKENNYKEALKVLNLIQGMNVGGVCGTVYIANKEFMNNKFAECYLNLDSLGKATLHLQRNIFHISKDYVPEVYPILIDKLKVKYTSNQLNSISELAINNLQLGKKNEYGEELKICYTYFLDMKIEIADENSWNYLNGEYDRVDFDSLTQELIDKLMLEECRKYIKNSKIISDISK